MYRRISKAHAKQLVHELGGLVQFQKLRAVTVVSLGIIFIFYYRFRV